MQRVPVILDTDIGSDIDDTWALAALLNSPELDCKLILTATGDTFYRAKVVARLLECANRTEIPIGVGVFRGQMLDCHRHQGPWVEDYDLADYRGTVSEDGIAALIDIVCQSPDPVTILSIAPCTNLAAALEKNPTIAAKCHFVGMLGSIHVGYDGKSHPEAETNVRMDVAACRRVLAASWRSMHITPLDTCGTIVLEGELYQKIMTSCNPLTMACMENYRIWADRVDWMKVDFVDQRTSVLFDNVAVIMAYRQDFFEFTPLSLEISDEGMTVPSIHGRTIQVALHWRDVDACKVHIAERILGDQRSERL